MSKITDVRLFFGFVFGEFFEIQKDAYVNVMNLIGVETEDKRFPYNDLGKVTAGSIIEVIGVQDGKFLVRYTPKEAPYGDRLPDGTEFLANLQDYKKLQRIKVSTGRNLEAERNTQRSSDIYNKPDE